MASPAAILMGLSGLGMLICFILVIVEMFKHGKTGVGVATIIGIFCGYGSFLALIYGWIKAGEWRIQKLMTAFTLCFLVYLGAFGWFFATEMPKMMAEQQKQMQMQMDQMKVQPPQVAPVEATPAIEAPSAEPPKTIEPATPDESTKPGEPESPK